MTVTRRQPSKDDPTVDEQPKNQPLVEVTPAANYQLSYEGTVAGPGETLSVPQDLADRWALAGLVDG